MMSKKKTKKIYSENSKTTSRQSYSSDNEKIIWIFDSLDVDGNFAFNLDIIETNRHLKEIFSKTIEYSKYTWSEIKKQTHDESIFKHHELDYDGMSSEAKERINKLHLDEYTDSIFSFALQNKLRIIGIRVNEKFYVKWYDPEHKFYPGKKKHT